MSVVTDLANELPLRPVPVILLLRARPSAITLEEIAGIRSVQLAQEARMAQANAIAAREAAEIDARVNVQLGALGISPSRSSTPAYQAPAVSPLRAYADLLVTLLVYRGDPPAGPNLTAAAEAILAGSFPPAQAAALAEREAHPIARPNELQKILASFGGPNPFIALLGAALALPRARIGAALAALGAAGVEVEASGQDPSHPRYFPVNRAITLESPWPWIGADLEAAGLTVTTLVHTQARFGGALFGGLQSIMGAAAGSPATLRAAVIPGGPTDTVTLNRTFEAWAQRAAGALRASRGAPSFRDVELGGAPGVALEFRWTQLLVPMFERRYLVPAPDGSMGVVLWWECPASEAPRWSRDVDDLARTLSFGADPPRRVRVDADVSTGVPEVDSALRGAWLFDVGQGDLAAARASADEALRARPSSRRARFARAVVSAVGGERAGALAEIEAIWPSLEEGVRPLVASFAARVEAEVAGLRPDGTLHVPAGAEGPVRTWQSRRHELVAGAAPGLADTLLVKASVEAAMSAAADPALAAELAKVGGAPAVLEAHLRDAAEAAAKAHLPQPAGYLLSWSNRIQSNLGDAQAALGRLERASADAAQAGDPLMSAWSAVLRADARIAAEHRQLARDTGAFSVALALPPGRVSSEAMTDARRALESAVERYRAAGARRGATLARLKIAAIDAAEGRIRPAAEAVRAALADAGSIGDRGLARDAGMLGVWIDVQRGEPDAALRRSTARIAEEAGARDDRAWTMSWASVFRALGAAHRARRDAARAAVLGRRDEGDAGVALSCGVVASALYAALGAPLAEIEATLDRVEALVFLEAFVEAAAEVESALAKIEEILAGDPGSAEAWGLAARCGLRAQQIYQGLQDAAMAQRVAARNAQLTSRIPKDFDMAAILAILSMDPAQAILSGKGDELRRAFQDLARGMAIETALLQGKIARFHGAFQRAQAAIEEGRPDRAEEPLAEARRAALDLGVEKDSYLAMCSALANDRARTVAEIGRWVEAGCPMEPRAAVVLREKLAERVSVDGADGQRELAASLRRCASLLERVGAWPEAKALIDRFDALPPAVKEDLDELAMAEWLIARARVAEGLGDAKTAEVRFAAAVAGLDRARAAQRSERLRRAVSAQRLFVDVHGARALFLAKAGRWGEAFEEADRVRARSLAEAASEALTAGQEAPSVRRLRASVERLGSELLFARAEAPDQVESLETALREAERELSEAAPDAPPPEIRRATPESVAKALGEGDLLIAYLCHRDRLLAWAVRPDGALRTHAVSEIEDRPFDARPFGARLRDLVRRLAETEPPASMRRDAEAELRVLGDLLLGPFAEEIRAAKRILFVPQGGLVGFPFGALAFDGGPLGPKKPIAHLHAAALVVGGSARAKAGAKPEPARVLVVGNPSRMEFERRADGSTTTAAPLPGAEEEATLVAALYGAEVLIGDAATRGKVSARLAEDPPPAIVHLATHGWFDDRVPLGSGVLLADGECLSADDWAGLRAPADVVILSACHTAGGQPQGGEIVGLTRMILLAGARAVVVSSWPVHDGVTVTFMTALHEALIAGASLEEACAKAAAHTARSPVVGAAQTRHHGVRDAKRKTPPPADIDPSYPAFWAPFLVVRASA